MNDGAVEQMIQAKGQNRTRVTPADIEANIASEHYLTVGSAPAALGACKNWETPASLNLLTICVLVLKNGFTVTGESACASPENFDAEIGRKIARDNAVNKMWPLMGYELRTRMAEGHAMKNATMPHDDEPSNVKDIWVEMPPSDNPGDDDYIIVPCTTLPDGGLAVVLRTPDCRAVENVIAANEQEMKKSCSRSCFDGYRHIEWPDVVRDFVATRLQTA